MKVILASYVDNGKWVNALISSWTWLANIGTPHSSHTEIILKKDGERIAFSSTNRDGAKGTRWEDPKKTFRHKKRWVFYGMEYSDEDIAKMVKRADSILDKGYDWLGIAGFATITGMLNSKEKWYCSEACWYVLTGDWKKRISPRKIIKEAKKLGFKKCSFG